MKKPAGISRTPGPSARERPTRAEAGRPGSSSTTDGPTREASENAEYLRDAHELSSLELEKKFSSLTPEKNARVAMLRAKRADFWSKRREQAKRAPSFLQALRGGSPSRSTGGSGSKLPRLQRDIVSDDDPEKILLDRFNRDMEAAQTLAGHVYTQIYRATGEAPPYDELHQTMLEIVQGNNPIAAAIRDPTKRKTLTELGYDLHQLFKESKGERLLPYALIRKAPYEFRTSQVKKDMFKIDVFTPDEKDSIGYAVFEIQAFGKRKPPSKKDPYTKEDVLAREGKVAHLHRLYNVTLTRNGPADIYRGFGVELLKRAETTAKKLGARLMYLEAATSDVRTSPSTDDKESVDPTPFYQRFGYSIDATSAAHNWALGMAQAKEMSLDTKQSIKLAQTQVQGLIEGMLSKALV